MKTKLRTYSVFTYDVWGDARDGFWVNNVFRQESVSIRCKRKVYNVGTEHEFESFGPTDLQLSRAVGVTGCEWEGDDRNLYATNKSNSKPVCELRFQGEPQ